MDKNGQTHSPPLATGGALRVPLPPRDWTAISSKILQLCEQPEFARKAFYQSGEPSCRFVDSILPMLRHFSIETVALSTNSDGSVTYHSMLTDLENNVPLSETFHVYGSRLWAEVIKAQVRRALVLTMVPPDLKDRAIERCREVTRSADTKDPQAVKRLVSELGAVGLSVSDLKRLGHPTLEARDLERLRGLLTALREGQLGIDDLGLPSKKDPEPEPIKKPAAAKKKGATKRKPAAVAATEEPPAAPPADPEPPRPRASRRDEAAETPPASTLGAVSDNT